MKLQFKNQAFQETATAAVCDVSVPQEALDVADPADFRLSGLKSPDGLAILQLVNSLHLSFLSCLAAETERICKSAPEIKGLGDPRLWFQALLLTNNREEPFHIFPLSAGESSRELINGRNYLVRWISACSGMLLPIPASC